MDDARRQRPEGSAFGVVVTRNPDPGFAERIRSLLSQVAGAVVVDNASSGQGLERVRAIAGESRVRLVENRENRGIAAALNQGLREGADAGAGWALLMDQDSVPHEDLLETLFDALHACPFRDRVAVVGAGYRDVGTGRVSPLPDDTATDGPWVERATVITAGSLVSLPIHREVGPFREDFFIDEVDHEYCLRARARGYRIIQARRVAMSHALGDSRVHRTPWGDAVTTGHSPERRYYMVRNHVTLAREYALREPRWVLGSLAARMATESRVLLLEPQRLRKLGAIGRGLLDGLLGRLGPLRDHRAGPGRG